VRTYPVRAGIRGGLVGGVVMAVIAAAYGIVSHHSIWYPLNLLVAGVYAPALEATTEQLARFHGLLTLSGLLIHGLTSLLVGTVYGMLLPMFPRRPIVAGGLVAPVVWSGVLYPMMGIINPVLAQRIDWRWFILSQIGFGLAAGVIVSRSLRIPTRQSEPFAARIGLEKARRP
jgi:flagellar biosynthesis protein FliR